MPTDTSGDPDFTPSQQAVLAALLDTLVPASEDGTMPSAAEAGFENYLETQARDFVAELQAILALLDPALVDRSPEARHEHVSEFSRREPARFGGLLARVYDCYYQDDRVRERIGMVRGPVFPQGNEVVQGDLSLLDPVIANRDQYRYRVP